MKKFSKILVLLLTFSLLLGSLAVLASAADDETAVASVTTGEVTTSYDSFDLAWEAAMAAPGSTIKLLKDVTLAEGAGYRVTADVTLDLGWNTLDATAAGYAFTDKTNNVVFYVADATTPAAPVERAFTVQNGRMITPDADILISSLENKDNRNGTLYSDITVNNVTITMPTTANTATAIFVGSPKNTNAYYDDTKSSNLVINNSYINAKYPIQVAGVWSEKGVVISATNSVFYDPLPNASGGKGSAIMLALEAYYGEYNFTNCYLYSAFRVVRPSITGTTLMGIAGETYTATEVTTGSYLVEKNKVGVWNFYDCMIEGEAEAIIHPSVYQMNIYGGYVSGTSNDWKLFGNNAPAATNQSYGCVTFYPYTAADGTVKYPMFSHNVKNATGRYYLQDFWDVTVTSTTNENGGTLATTAVEKEAPNGYIVSNSGDSKYKYAYIPAAEYNAGTKSLNVAAETRIIQSAAIINGQGYATVAAAVAAAKAEDIVILLANVDNTVTVSAPVNVLTNGFTFAPTLADGLMIGIQTSAFTNVVEIPEDAEFVTHYYWETDTAIDNAFENWTGDWETLDNEVIAAGNGPDGLLAVVYAPKESTLDYSTIQNSGYDASYVDEETGDLYVQEKWTVVNSDGWTFDYVPQCKNVGVVSYIVTNDLSGEVVGSGKTAYDFLQAMSTAASGTTVKLLADIALTSDNNPLSSNQFTLDLNGYTLSLSTGNCLKETGCTTAEHVVGHNATWRVMNTHNITLTSSKAGGVIYNYGGTKGNQLFWMTSNTANGTVTIDGKNLTIYTPVLWANNGTNNTINIDGGKYVSIKSYSNSWAIFQQGSMGNSVVNVKNALIDSTYQNLTSCQVATTTIKQTATFENCTIILPSSSSHYFCRLNNTHTPDNTTINLKSCVVLGSRALTAQVGLNAVYPTINIYEGCYFAKGIDENTPYNLVDCQANTDVAGAYTLGVTTTYGYASKGKAYSAETHTSEYLASNTKVYAQDVAFTTATKTLAESFAAVNYTVDGNAFKTIYFMVFGENGAYVAPYSASVTENFIKSTYSTTESATLTAVGESKTIALTLSAKEAAVSGIKYNLTLASEIAINVAIPADVMEFYKVWIPDVGTFTKDDLTLVTIGEEQYYVASYTGITAIKTVDSIKIKVFAAADESVAKYIEVSVVAYANKLMTKGANDVECELGRALLVYTLEAYKALDAENSTAIEALEAYEATVKTDASFMPDDTTMLARVFKGAYLRLEGTPGIVFEVSDTMSLVGVTVSFTYVDENLETVTETVTLNSTNPTYELEMKVYNLDQNITVSIDGQPLELSYNLDTYLASLATENNAFAQAIYHYVAAAKAYVAPVVAE
ncbi:MAG: hypothetical protein IJY65_00330 [Clostridia bacterium]|nr:hypothetical protein [Clostridia bacterium]